MSILHHDHVRHIFHDEHCRLQFPHDADKLRVKLITWIVRLSRSDLAKALTWRSAIDEIDICLDQILAGWHASLFVSQETADVPFEERDVLEICCVCFACCRIKLDGTDHFEFGEPDALAEFPAPAKSDIALRIDGRHLAAIASRARLDSPPCTFSPLSGSSSLFVANR